MQNSRLQSSIEEKRRQFSVRIRKEQREDLFAKRRNMGMEVMEESIDEEKNNDMFIIDPRYAQQIKQLINRQYAPTQFNSLAKKLMSLNEVEVHQGIIGLRILLNMEEEKFILRFVDLGLINRAIELIKQKEYPQLKLQATWALANVASGPTDCCKKLVERGVVDILVKLLYENEQGIVDQAIWGFANLAADCTNYRDLILKAGGIAALIHVIDNTDKLGRKKNCIWGMTSLVRGSPKPRYQLVKKSVAYFCKAVETGLLPENIQKDCLNSISSICEGKSERLQILIELKFLPILFKLAQSANKKQFIPALKAIGNISAGTNQMCEVLLKQGICDLALNLLSHEKKAVRQEISWILSNLSACSQEHTQYILNHPSLLPKIMESFQTEIIDVQRELCWVISSMASTGDKNLIAACYMKYDVIRVFVNLLGEENEAILENTIECLYKILKLGAKLSENPKNNVFLNVFNSYGGSERLQNLQLHSSKKVYERASKLMKKFFQIEEMEIEL